MKQPRLFNLCRIIDLGLVEYEEAFKFQQEILSQRIKGTCPDTLILCEHLPVFTLGRLSKWENILADEATFKNQNLKIISINRGGDITLHNPGQLVAYPIFDLAGIKKDLKLFLNRLEQLIIEFLSDFGCQSARKSGFTGVWFNDKKIASIGIGVKKWVSFHGLAININNDLNLFSLIKPCGLDVEMASLSKIKNYKIDMEIAKDIIIKKFAEIFYLKFEAPF